MTRYIFIVTIALVYSSTLCAQDEHPAFAIGINLANLLHAQSTALDIVADIRLSGPFSMRIDGGPMINLIRKRDLRVRKFTGWQLGLGTRYYFKEDPGEVYSMFAELRGKYKSYNATIAGDFFIDNEFGIYKQRINYLAEVEEFNVQVGFGQSFTFDQFRMDIVVGIGPASVDIKYKDIPNNALFDTNGTNLWEPDKDYNPYPEHFIFFEWILGYTF